jgi:hypothetical protein
VVTSLIFDTIADDHSLRAKRSSRSDQVLRRSGWPGRGVCTAPIGTNMIAVAALAKIYGQGPVDRVSPHRASDQAPKPRGVRSVQRYNVCPIVIHRAPSDAVSSMHSDMFDGEVAFLESTLTLHHDKPAGTSGQLTARVSACPQHVRGTTPDCSTQDQPLTGTRFDARVPRTQNSLGTHAQQQCLNHFSTGLRKLSPSTQHIGVALCL